MAARGISDQRRRIVPRAGDLERLEPVVEMGALGLLSPHAISDRLEIERGEAEELLELGKWFGFVDEEGSDLTEQGRRFVGQAERRPAIAREVLWGRPLVRRVMGHPAWSSSATQAAREVVAERTDLPSGEVGPRARQFVELLEETSLLDARGPGEEGPSEELPSPGELPVAVLGLSDEEREKLGRLGVETVEEFVEVDEAQLVARFDETDGGGRHVERLGEEARRLLDCETGEIASVGRRLSAASWSMDDDWHEVLVDLPTRAVSGFEKADFESVGEVVVAGICCELTRLPGIGESTAEAVAEQVALIAEQGYEVYLYGPGGRPQTVTELADQLLNSLADEDREVMRLRFLEGETFRDIGERFGLTRQRMRQKTGDYLERLRGHYREVARGLVGPLVDRLEAGAGLVHRAEVELWTGCSDLYRVLLAVLLLDESAYIWNDHFIANRASTRLERGPVARVRRGIADANGVHVSIREVVGFARRAGIALDREGARDLVETIWGLSCDVRGRVVNRWAKKGDRIAEVLVDARRRLGLEAIAERYAERYATDEEADPTARRVQPFVKQHPKLYTVGNGVYVHEVALPVNRRVLDDVVDWCLERIRGETTAVSVKVLLEDLRDSEFAVGDHIESLNWYLLRDVLLRRPEVIGFHNTFNVAWEETYEQQGVTLLDRVERILAELGGVVSAGEVVEHLPEDFEVNPHSVENYLVAEPFSIRLGDDRYIHRANLELSDETYETILETALELLPEDGTVVATPQLVEKMADREETREFARRRRAEEELWGMLRHDERVETSPELLVARGEGEEPELLKRAIREVLGEKGAAYPREVDEALEQRFGFVVSDSRVYRRMRELASASDLGRLSNGLYYLTAEEDAELFERFDRRRREMIRLARRANLSDFDSRELHLMARFFAEIDRPSSARNVLEVLLERGGDPAVYRRWRGLYDRVVDQLESRPG